MKIDNSYITWLQEIKQKVLQTQIRASFAVNNELIGFYWGLGESIFNKLQENAWGNKIIDQLSKDLSSEFPDIKGFSRTNLYYVKKFYEFFSGFLNSDLIIPQAGGQLELTKNSGQKQLPEIIPQLGGQLPWGHIKIILDKVKDHQEALFYINEILENGWGRETLALQIKAGLFKRQGKAITNFHTTLPAPQSDLAQQTIKDPYNFDFLALTKPYNERDIENQLMDHITRFLLELGKGFAFIGRQYHLEVGQSDYYIDLLFYHLKLRCYVVVELKNTKFIPEYSGKLNFYLSAVDSILKTDLDNPTIGMLLCRDKDQIETEFALRDINKPMGVSEFTLTEIVPDQLRGSLPTIEEIELDLKKHHKDS